MLDRHFLIGAGGLLTASFVNQAKAFLENPASRWSCRRPESPRILSTSTGRRYGATPAANGACRSGPINRSHHRLRPGASICARTRHPLDTDDEIERACIEHDLPPEELDVRLNGFGWEDSWDNFTGPQAKAHHLLKGLDLGYLRIGAKTGRPDDLRGVRRISWQFLYLG